MVSRRGRVAARIPASGEAVFLQTSHYPVGRVGVLGEYYRLLTISGTDVIRREAPLDERLPLRDRHRATREQRLKLSQKDIDRLLFDVGFFLVRVDRSLERHVAVLRDDLDVVGVGRERVVFDNRAPDVARDFDVRSVLFLLIGGDFAGVAVALVYRGVIGLDRLFVRGGSRAAAAQAVIGRANCVRGRVRGIGEFRVVGLEHGVYVVRNHSAVEANHNMFADIQLLECNERRSFAIADVFHSARRGGESLQVLAVVAAGIQRGHDVDVFREVKGEIAIAVEGLALRLGQRVAP